MRFKKWISACSDVNIYNQCPHVCQTLKVKVKVDKIDENFSDVAIGFTNF